MLLEDYTRPTHVKEVYSGGGGSYNSGIDKTESVSNITSGSVVIEQLKKEEDNTVDLATLQEQSDQANADAIKNEATMKSADDLATEASLQFIQAQSKLEQLQSDLSTSNENIASATGDVDSATALVEDRKKTLDAAQLALKNSINESQQIENEIKEIEENTSQFNGWRIKDSRNR